MRKLGYLAVGVIAAGVAVGGCSAAPEASSQTASQAVSAGQIFNFGAIAHPGSCMDAAGGGTGDGTQIQEWSCNGSGAQSYELEDAGGGNFKIVNTSANKCVDVNAAATANGTKVQLWDCNGSGAQSFRVTDAGNGFVNFVNTNSNKCLDVAADNPADGTKVQLWDCNGTNAQRWNPTVIGNGGGGGGGGGGGAAGVCNASQLTHCNCPSTYECCPIDGSCFATSDQVVYTMCKDNTAAVCSMSGNTGTGGGGGGNTGGGGGGGSGVTIKVTNSCPVDLWIRGVGQQATLQPDNAHLSPGASQSYTAPLTWTAGRVYAYFQGPDASGNPQGQNDKVEMTFTASGSTTTMNTDITYVDWVALPSQIQAIGSGSDCTTVGCEVPYSQILSGCPSSLVNGHECNAAGNYCLDPTHNGDPYCHALDGQIAACAAQQPGCAGAAGASTADVYACAGPFFSQNPQWCAALNRGVLSNPGPGTPSSQFYVNPPYNTYSKWVHGHCPNIYAFPYDDYGSSNQSSDHTCTGATQLNITFCPKG